MISLFVQFSSYFPPPDFVLVYLEGEKPPPPKHAEYRQTFLENLAKSQLEFEEVKNYFYTPGDKLH